ncbi:MAG: hypothetical protein DI586_03825 [Micavibrio aeruginosavorus]|uniref:Alpha/beta hydrolase n=1 Tax=Micavibrio aeruginosavorus TaxID=349221 RepID=A0A2W5FKA7_9BACT|nr:MAG: hypothetical protein DI586_03825 [Micavibrio aeruginosavorus]
MTAFKKIRPHFSDTLLDSASILSGQNSFYLFLGGLLHVNNIENGKGLSGTLGQICERSGTDFPIYSLILNNEPNVSHTASQMYAYQNEELVTKEAAALVNELFLPDSLLDQVGNIKEGRRNQILAQHFRRFNLVGYSYGTSLIQQVEQILEDRFGLLGYDTVALKEIAAVNIGPVAQPRIRLLDGSVNRLSTKAPTEETSSLFKQLFVMGHTDKVSSETIGKAFLHQDNDDLSVFGNRDIRVLTDYAGDDMLRRAGVTVYASGLKSPRIDYNLDFEGHALRLYTNKLELQESGSGALMICFPSKAVSPVITKAVEMMAIESLSGVECRRDFHLAATGEKNILDASAEYTKLSQEFNDILSHHRNGTFHESLDNLDRIISGFPNFSARFPLFT